MVQTLKLLGNSPYLLDDPRISTKTSIRLAYKTVWACVLVFVRALVFLLLSGDQGCVYKGIFGTRLRVCRDCFYSLSDRRSYERCEGAWKTVVSWTLSSCTARVGVLGYQLFSAAGNTETGFSDLISIAFITAWPSFVKEGACQG